MRVHPILDAVYKTWVRLIWDHGNIASQTTHLIVTIVNTTEQPLVLLTYPTSAQAPGELYD